MSRKFNVIGLMSGTSMDGLDLAFCSFENNNKQWIFDIHQAETVPYPNEWLTSLNSARELSDEDLYELSLLYGRYLSDCVVAFIDKYELEDVDFIASHGHTIHHKPSEGITVQIGDGNVISNQTKLPVVYDFRIQDVELGGQGAPLVPVGDILLFSEYQACLNLGGFANISFDYEGSRVAFDISPINIVLNYLTRKVGRDYDFGGEMASKGQIIPALLEQLNALDYYNMPIPKSLGIEWVEMNLYPLLLKSYEVNDMLLTVVIHVSQQVSQVLNQYDIQNILVTGGGVYNTYFMDKLRAVSVSSVIVPDDIVVEFKEALIFGFMGVLRMDNRINVLKSVTGANQDHSSGKMAFPDK